MSAQAPRRAVIVGTGLIGGSIGLALRADGWWVAGVDRSPRAAARALELGAIDEIGELADADLAVVATPVLAVADTVERLLAAGAAVVTDVGSVKGQISAAVTDPRFVGGHPMAGSEQVGVDGARADLFVGATWVLTPTATTGDDALLAVRTVVQALGAEAVTLDPADHDQLVAVVSHVPHLTAATLMRLAGRRSLEHGALLRLAAGGFRDMTRIAAGHPGIWPDICEENRDAIVGVLDDLLAELAVVRRIVADDDRDALYAALADAQEARLNLPTSRGLPSSIVELRVSVADRPGSLAEVTTLASSLDVNILDLEIAHSGEGGRGVLVLLVGAVEGERLTAGLREAGFAATTAALP